MKSFKQFYFIWVEQNHPDWEVPACQLELIEFLDDANWGDSRKKVVLCHRELGKSTIVDVYVAYRIYRDPEIRITCVSHQKEFAIKSSRNVLRILKTHPLCEGLVSETLETRREQFFVDGSADPRNPTLTAFGIGTSGTGGRSDLIIFDDVEDKNNTKSAGLRSDLRHSIEEVENTNVANTGQIIFIGTPHTEETIYEEQVATGARVIRLPIIEDVQGEYPKQTGRIRWPEKYSKKEILKLQTKSKNVWRSQYLLLPVSIEDSHFDVAHLEPRRYPDEMQLFETGRRWRAKLVAKGKERHILSASCWWDPALSTARGDDSVVALVLTDEESQHYLHKFKILKGDANQQCDQVKQFALKNHVACVCIEKNGPGAYLEQLLINVVKKHGIAVEGIHTTGEKGGRIIEAFEGRLYAGTIWIHQAVYDSDFLKQFGEFKPAFVKNQKIDIVDAFASALSKEPVYIHNHYDPLAEFKQHWQHADVAYAQDAQADAEPFTHNDVGDYSMPG